MTEAKEVKPSVDDVSLSVNNDSVSVTTTETVREKHTEDMEDAGKKEDREEEELEEEEEEEEEDDEEEEEVDEEGEEEEVEDDSDEETEESDEDTEEEIENKKEPGPVDVSIDGGKVMNVEVSLEKNPDRIVDSPIHGVENSIKVHSDDAMPLKDDGGVPVAEASVKSDMATNQKFAVSNEKDCSRHDIEEDHGVKSDSSDSFKDRRFDNESVSRNHFSSLKVEHTKEEMKNGAIKKDVIAGVAGGNPSKSFIFDTDTSGGGESGTEDEQTEFMMELDKFHKERSLDFKPPKFYGEPLNLLKLWRSVLKLGGYDKVTACKFWRQVGESFKPPKTCTTVSWTFRIFYEKALLDYERYRTSSDGSNIPGSLAVPMGAESQAAGSRARRDAAARCMQGWHSQRILDNGEVSDPIIKDKNSNSLNKKEKQLKNLGVLKRKSSNSTDQAVRPVRAKLPKSQTETTVIDIGSPADWVKINVRETKDCYEVYALVPGLLREEVRVQSDPAGRLVISGEPENPDNPWSVTPFKKVVSLPSRIDPHQTSAVVTLHGQLFVRVPFEQYD